MKKLLLIALVSIIATACSMDQEVNDTTINNYYYKKTAVDSIGVGFNWEPIVNDSIIG